MGSGLLVLGMAIDEDGFQTQIFAEFDVGQGVADHEAGVRLDFRELGLGLFEEAGQGLAAVALMLVVRAEVEAVDVGLAGGEQALQPGVDLVNVGGGIQAKTDAALVGDDEHAEPRLVEAGDGIWDAGEQFEVMPGSDILSLGHLAVDDPVAVEEDGFDGGGRGRMLRSVGSERHPAMIAIS